MNYTKPYIALLFVLCALCDTTAIASENIAIKGGQFGLLGNCAISARQKKVYILDYPSTVIYGVRLENGEIADSIVAPDKLKYYFRKQEDDSLYCNFEAEGGKLASFTSLCKAPGSGEVFACANVRLYNCESMGMDDSVVVWKGQTVTSAIENNSVDNIMPFRLDSMWIGGYRIGALEGGFVGAGGYQNPGSSVSPCIAVWVGIDHTTVRPLLSLVDVRKYYRQYNDPNNVGLIRTNSRHHIGYFLPPYTPLLTCTVNNKGEITDSVGIVFAEGLLKEILGRTRSMTNEQYVAYTRQVPTQIVSDFFLDEKGNLFVLMLDKTADADRQVLQVYNAQREFVSEREIAVDSSADRIKQGAIAGEYEGQIVTVLLRKSGKSELHFATVANR